MAPRRRNANAQLLHPGAAARSRGGAARHVARHVTGLATRMRYAERRTRCLQVAVYGAFGVELFAMFCVGEIAGRGFTLTEYSY